MGFNEYVSLVMGLLSYMGVLQPLVNLVLFFLAIAGFVAFVRVLRGGGQ